MFDEIDLWDATDLEIVDAINDGNIPSEELVSRDGWAEICRVRGRYFSQVDPEAWADLCSTRGYLMSRRNPRGF